MTIRYYWHIHHDQLWDRASEPIENRIAYIEALKPPHEIALRLRLLREITGPAIERLQIALQAYEAVEGPAWQAYQDVQGPAWQAYEAVQGPAWQAYKAVEKMIDFERLHREQCPDCPWDGKSIFKNGARS